LLHEPLLQTMRELRAYDKKIRRAIGKKNDDLAKKLADHKPGMRMDHLVRERYPSFVDALRDMDDALSLTTLFATLPASGDHGIPEKVVTTARQLALEFQAYCVKAHALRRAFISVKGYYFQAEIMGQQITWIAPHQLAQILPDDVDYRVMVSFVEFYQTFLKFTHFKLFHTLGLAYPPVLDARLDEAAAGVEAMMREIAARSVGPGPTAAGEESSDGEGESDGEEGEGMDERRQRMREMASQGVARLLAKGQQGGESGGESSEEEEEEEEEEEDGDESGEEVAIDSGDEGEEDSEDEDDETGGDGPGGAAPSANPAAMVEVGEQDGGDLTGGSAGAGDDDAKVCATLFKGLVFWVSREVPRDQVSFVLRAFGGEVAWDGEGSPYAHNDERITHEVVDRPRQAHQIFSRTYIQPQWVFDSANFRILAPATMYAPGIVPPPHLSPFVNDEEEGYEPDHAKFMKRLSQQAAAARRAGVVAHLTERDGQEEEDMTAPAKLEKGAEQRFQEELREELGAAPEEIDGDSDASDAPTRARKRGADGETGGPDIMEEEQDDAEAVEAAKKGLMTSKQRKFLHRIEESRKHKKAKVDTLERRKLARQSHK